MDASLLLMIAAGSVAGLALGAMGGGGSVLLIPLLVLAFGLDAHAATGTALVVVLATSLLGTVLHTRAGRVRYREAALFSAPGIAASALFSPLNARLSEELILGVVALLMFVVALRMWRPIKPSEARRPAIVVIVAGAAVGALTGLFGVGGGFVVVPALVLVLGFPMHAAVGTSLVVIAANASAAVGGYWLRGDIDIQLALILAAGAALGVTSGATLARLAGEQRLQQSFAVLLVAMSIFLTVREAVAIV